jgi:hypothetical protein
VQNLQKGERQRTAAKRMRRLHQFILGDRVEIELLGPARDNCRCGGVTGLRLGCVMKCADVVPAEVPVEASAGGSV